MLAGTVAVVGLPERRQVDARQPPHGPPRDAWCTSSPGVTRDRKEVDVEWNGKRFRLVDTGGIDVEGPGIAKDVAAQARFAVAEADLVLFVVDSQIGHRAGRRGGRRHPAPRQGADDRRGQQGRGGGRGASRAVEFHALGLGDPVPVSAIHGTGSGDLLDLIVDRAGRDPGRRARGGRDRRDRRRHPRPSQRRQVEPAQRARRRAAGDRLRGAGHDARLHRHAPGARRHRRTA